MQKKEARIRRSFLFAPADRPDRVAKAAGLSVDVVVLEMEDGVAPQNKAGARKEAGNLLQTLDFGRRETALRINRISTPHGLQDLLSLSLWPRKPDLIMLPKVESAAEIRLYDELLTHMNVASELMVLIESSRGLLEAAAIVTASPRVTALAFGIADLTAELGCRQSWEVMAPYRSSLITACGFADIQAVDAPFLKIKDVEGLVLECTQAKSLGFRGKLCIHPSQLEPVNKMFSPAENEIEQAKRIVAAVVSQGGGAIVVDGRMVDAPVVKKAQRVVDAAKMLGLI